MSGELPFLEFSEFITGGISAWEYADFDDRADIRFELNGKRITLSVFATSLEGENRGRNEGGRFEDQFIFDLAEAADIVMDDMGEYALLVDDIAMSIGDWSRSRRQDRATLDDLLSALYPKEFDFRLQTIDGKSVIFPISPKDAAYVREEYVPDPNFTYEPPAGLSLPRYASKDIMIEEEYFGGIFSAAKARIGSQILFCKAFASGINHSDLDKEVETHHKIHQACIKAGIQIRMGFLHSFGFFWGDGKAANVVIDPNNDAWLIDLAGGLANGWVDKKATGTMEGENQALQRMTAYLGFAN